MTREELIGKVKVELERVRDELEFAVLFGSWTRNRARCDSDVDIAVMPAGDWSLADELRIQAGLVKAARAAVDLVRLDGAKALVAWEVVRHGTLLVGEHARYARYQAKVALEHADAAPLLQDGARRYAQRIAELGILR